LPSNTGAGYVIRRILRRAIRYGFTFEYQRTFYLSIGSCFSGPNESFPEIKKQQGLVTNVIQRRRLLLRTLDQGLQLLDNVSYKSRKEEVAKHLNCTILLVSNRFNGFILRERGFSLDEAGFDKAMLEQKTRSRAPLKFQRMIGRF
jgi:alanyl-tRNA synthetase